LAALPAGKMVRRTRPGSHLAPASDHISPCRCRQRLVGAVVTALIRRGRASSLISVHAASLSLSRRITLVKDMLLLLLLLLLQVMLFLRYIQPHSGVTLC